MRQKQAACATNDETRNHGAAIDPRRKNGSNQHALIGETTLDRVAMFVATKDRPIVTTTTGALPRPSWFTESLRGRPFSAGMVDRAYREQYIDTIACHVINQTRAGIEILVDGDARFDDDVAGRGWFAYVSERLGGIGTPEPSVQPVAHNRDKVPGDFLFEVMETRLPPRVTGRVSRGPLEYDRVWKVIQAMTEKPVKIGSISAQLLEALINNQYYQDRRELITDLSAAMNQEYHALADAGCAVIQIEEPYIHEIVGIIDHPDPPPEFYVEAFNREVRGLRDKTEVWCHTCWGSPGAQRVEHRHLSYEPSLPYFDQLDVDVITFEGAENQGADFERIGKGIGKGKKIAVGVVSHRTLQIERPDDVAALIRKALKHIEPERLILTTDCGFGRQGMSRTHALYKMIALVRGTNIVRQELGLEPAPIPAADPRFAMVRDA